MSVSYKAVAIAQQLLNDLNQRGPLTFVLGQASDGYPTLTSYQSATPTAGQQNIAIKVINYLSQQNAAAVTATAPLPYVDELGLQAYPFTPTEILVTLEQLSGNTGTLVVKSVNLAPVLMAASLTGAEVRTLLVNNTVVPLPGAGTLSTDFNAQIQYPGTATM